MRSFYLNINSDINELVPLPEEESRHICKVLRLTEGDNILLVNGEGFEYEAEISVAHAKKCVVCITNSKFIEKDPYHIHIAIAPTKNIDRFEWFLEKSTELGIHEITPLLCENNERKIIKLDRSAKILIAAMKQSKRAYLPKLNELTTFDDFITLHPNAFIAHCYAEEKNTLSPSKAQKDTPVIIGPEGDFSEKEVKIALAKGYVPITLGKTRLRTETAGLYACSLLKYQFE